MIRPLAIACASGVIGVVAPITAPPAHAAAGTDGACPDNVGVTVVVDFGGLGGGVSVRCAPTGGATGLAVLDAAGVSWEGTRRFPGMVCRIAGLPSAGAEPCVNAPPANAYWSYWMAPRGGSWCYSALGPGNRTPPLGSIEGWSFARLTPGADATPPHMEPLAPVDGATPHPITPGDCGSAAPTPAPTPTTAGAATNSATTVCRRRADPRKPPPRRRPHRLHRRRAQRSHRLRRPTPPLPSSDRQRPSPWIRRPPRRVRPKPLSPEWSRSCQARRSPPPRTRRPPHRPGPQARRVRPSRPLGPWT